MIREIYAVDENLILICLAEKSISKCLQSSLSNSLYGAQKKCSPRFRVSFEISLLKCLLSLEIPWNAKASATSFQVCQEYIFARLKHHSTIISLLFAIA